MHARLAPEHAESLHSSDCDPAVIAACVVVLHTTLPVRVVNRISCGVAPFTTAGHCGRPRVPWGNAFIADCRLTRFPAIASVHCADRWRSGRLFFAPGFFFSFRVCVCLIFVKYGCRRRLRRAAAFRPDDAGCCCAAFLRISPKFAPLKEADSNTQCSRGQSTPTSFFNSAKFPLSRPAGQNQQLFVLYEVGRGRCSFSRSASPGTIVAPSPV